MLFATPKIFSDIYTNRLILREPRISDTGDVYEFCSSLDATRYVDWYPHTDKYQTAAYIRYLKRQIAIGNTSSYTWLVEQRLDKKVIATISVTGFDSSGKIATVGYTFNRHYQNKGYATEALLNLMHYLFTKRGVERIEAKVLPENERSIKLLERVGMKREARLKKGVSIKGKLCDVLIYAILKEEFCGKNTVL